MPRIPLATLAVLALAAAPAGAIVVDSTADSVLVDGDCTLREAINNVNAGADTTGGDCATGRRSPSTRRRTGCRSCSPAPTATTST